MLEFILLTEGSSDRNLVDFLESLLVSIGYDEVHGHAPDFGLLPNPIGHSVQSKVDKAIVLHPNVDMIFVHRDADNQGFDVRVNEILGQTGHIENHIKIIPLVIDKALEAWLILDEAAIKEVSGFPLSKFVLNLPSPEKVHNVSNPKQFLKNSLRDLSGLAGARLDKFCKNFARHRMLLVQGLEVGGPVSRTLAHQRLCKYLEN